MSKEHILPKDSPLKTLLLSIENFNALIAPLGPELEYGPNTPPRVNKERYVKKGGSPEEFDHVIAQAMEVLAEAIEVVAFCNDPVKGITKPYDVIYSVIVKLHDKGWLDAADMMYIKGRFGIQQTLAKLSGMCRRFHDRNGHMLKNPTIREATCLVLMDNGHIVSTGNGSFHKYEQGVYSEISGAQLSAMIDRTIEMYVCGKKPLVVTKSYRNELIDKLKLMTLLPGNSSLNQNWQWINLRNCMFNIDTGATLDHSPKFLSTVQLPFDFDPSAQCPNFIKFLEEILPEDVNKQLFIQEFFGCCLVPENQYQIFVVMQGTGGNGKSKLIEVLKNLVGQGNYSSLAINELSSKFRVHMLKDKLLNVGTENESRVIRDSSMLKKIVGGDDDIVGEQKFKDPMDFRTPCKFIFMTNHLLKFVDTSEGLRRRLRVVPFSQKFEGERRDLRILEKLLPELPGIFNWAVSGYRRLKEQNGVFTESALMVAAADNFLEFSSPAVMFVNAMCEVGDLSASVGRTELYRAYCEFCKIEKQPIVGRSAFIGELRRQYPMLQFPETQVRLAAGRDRIIHGIKIADPEASAADGRTTVAGAAAEAAPLPPVTNVTNVSENSTTPASPEPMGE